MEEHEIHGLIPPEPLEEPEPWVDYDPTVGCYQGGEWHEWTEEELAHIAELRAEFEESNYNADVALSLPDAVSELAEMSADNEVDIADIQDAIVELAAMVAELMQ